MSSNMYDLLSNDEQHSKKPQEKELPGKPDKTEQRRSVPRGGAAAAGGRGGSSAESRPQSSRPRVDDRDRRGGRGGANASGPSAGRGGRGGGRGGYHGNESDGVHRNFDRKQGEHTRYAPGEARKHGAVGEVDPTHFAGSASEFAAQDAALVAEVVGDEILDITPMPTDPDDAKMTYDEYLAQRNRPDEDVNRQTREVSDDQGSEFKAVKPFKKVEESIFGDVAEASKEEKASTGASKANKKKAKISLDEFVGERPAAASSSERGGRGGASSGRGGRGGFQGESSRGGFQGESRGGRGGATGAPRGGRGGFDGPRGAPRGGRGGAAAGPRAPAANVNLADQSAFPALSPK